MTELLIKKVIATEGEREIVDSSYEEMYQFKANGSRTDFLRGDVLCVKFLICDNHDAKDAEETCWYINPSYASKIASYCDTDNNDFCYPNCIFITDEDDAIKMPSNMLPELILMYFYGDEKSIFEQYCEFEASVLNDNYPYASDKEKYDLFVQSLI